MILDDELNTKYSSTFFTKKKRIKKSLIFYIFEKLNNIETKDLTKETTLAYNKMRKYFEAEIE